MKPGIVSLVVLAIILISILFLIFTVPAVREVAVIEANVLLPGTPLHDLYPLEGVTLLARESSGDQSDDWEVVLGRSLLAEDPVERIELAKEAVTLAPKEPAALSALAQIYIENLDWERAATFGYGREPDENFEEMLLSAEAARPARETLEQLRLVDQDNAAPEAMLAWLDFGERRDEAALARWGVASHLPRIDFYTAEQTAAAVKAMKAAGIPAFESEGLAPYVTNYRILAYMRENARVAAYLGKIAQLEGRDEVAIKAWMDTIRLGRLMRTQSKMAIESLVGIAVEAIGAAPAYKWTRMELAKQWNLKPVSKEAGESGRFNEGDIFVGEDLDFFVAQAGEAAAAKIYAGLEESLRFKKEFRGYVEIECAKSDGVLKTFWRAIGMFWFGCIILELLLIFLFALLVGLLATKGKCLVLTSPKSWKWIWLTAAASAGILYLLSYGISITLADSGLLATDPLRYDCALAVLAGSIGAFVYIYFPLCSCKREPLSWRGFVAYWGMVGLVGSLACGLTYSITTLQTAALRTKATAQMQQARSGDEMEAFRRQYPQYFEIGEPLEE